MIIVLAWLLAHLLFVVETGLVLFAARMAFTAPQLGHHRFQQFESALGGLARRRALATLCVGVAALITRAALLPVEPVPQPTVHDEFSYLLAADTFASGRLANPVHPLWQHFETMQEDSLPAYASMYPPAPGLVLAFGKRVFGQPFVGVWLSAALMCAAMCWMFQGWLPPGWALLGASLVLIRLGTFSYWADSYYGGAIAATGGALVLGALPRILRTGRPRIATSLLLSSGIALLLNSRPYEGVVLSATSAAILLVRATSRRDSGRPLIRRCFLPALLFLLPAAAFMGYYNWRAFGSPIRLPYQVNRETYAMAPVFIWQRPDAEPAYRHQVMRDFFARWEMDHFTRVRTLTGFIQFTGEKIERFWRFFIGPVLTVPLLMFRRVLRDRRMRPLVITATAFAIGLAVQAWFVPHYAAPITALLWVILLQCMRHLRTWHWREKPVGLALVRMVPMVCIAMMVVRIASAAAVAPVWLRFPGTWATVWTVRLHREVVIERLEKISGLHLVIVRYSEKHDPFQEYVFNDADIDHSRIVWAREMSAEQNRRLTGYFHGRRIWLLEPDGPDWKLSPYPTTP